MLAWRKQNPVEAKELYDKLSNANLCICATMEKLHEYCRTEKSKYIESVAWCCITEQQHWSLSSNPVAKTFAELRDHFRSSRVLLRTLGENAGVEVEPPCQTRLVDASEAVKGVLCAGVPGAGGVDAIYALTLSPSSRNEVEKIWANWKDTTTDTATSTIGDVCPLTLSAASGSQSGIQFASLKW